MTDEMLELARANQREAGVENVEFLKGTIEDVPLPDDSVDVIISNCVINLSRRQARASSARRPGCCAPAAASPSATSSPTRAWTRPPAATWQQWTGCIAGALTGAEYARQLAAAGFEAVEIEETHRVHEHAASAIIRAIKAE